MGVSKEFRRSRQLFGAPCPIRHVVIPCGSPDLVPCSCSLSVASTVRFKVLVFHQPPFIHPRLAFIAPVLPARILPGHAKRIIALIGASAMLPSTTTTSRSNRGGGGPKHRRGGLRNKDNNGTGSAASSDDESVRKGRKVHFSADSQTQSSSAASRGQRANNANRGASSSRGGRAASARGGPASSTASNPLAQIKAHIGGSNTNGAARGPAPNSSTTNLLQSFEERYVLVCDPQPSVCPSTLLTMFHS